MWKYHLIAFVTGFVLDLCFGDPYTLPHPIRLIGHMITALEKRLYGNKRQRLRGAVLTVLVVSVTAAVSGLLLVGAYVLHPVLGVVVESVMSYQALAIKCLKDESMKVYDKLTHGTLEDAKKAVSMIVGRDTAQLDAQGVARAAVETVAENTSDGCIAPMLYLAIGGPVLAFAYKAVNTLDSMIGYKNEKYLYFGRCAAKLDDVVNFLPARVSAVLMILSVFFLGKEFDGRRAIRIYLRDKRKHASPNSAQTEAVCAGALGVRLAGNASYFGTVVEKPYIGEDVRPIEAQDIRRANRLLYATAALCEGICACLLLLAAVTM